MIKCKIFEGEVIENIEDYLNEYLEHYVSKIISVTQSESMIPSGVWSKLHYTITLVYVGI